METNKKGITNTTLINAEIAELIGALSGDEALLLFIGLRHCSLHYNPTPSFSKNVDRLREEGIVTLSAEDLSNPARLKFWAVEKIGDLRDKPFWAPLLEFFDAKNVYLAEKIEAYLSNLGEDDDVIEYKKSGGSSSVTEIQDEDEGGCAGSSAEPASSQSQDEDDSPRP